MRRPVPNPWKHRSRRSRAFRRAVLHLFSEAPGNGPQSLVTFSQRDWNANLPWLDSSGLALYLLQQLVDFGQQGIVPPKILTRLQQNLEDNTVRNETLFAEASELSRRFQHENVLFANLKGLTLWPDSVPHPALRCQLDLDFIVHRDHAGKAGRVLETLGYQRACISGNTWEYKTASTQIASVKDLYKTRPQRSAELHLASSTGPLDRVRIRSFGPAALPVLSPVDLYLSQAVHLFKHVRSSFTRAAWLLEYRRHMLARHHDEAFWNEIHDRARSEPSLALALAVVTLLVAEIFGDTPPELLSRLIAIHVSPGVRLWIQTYWPAALLADFPGTKLYLLLEAELPSVIASGRTARRRDLLPLAPPPSITHRPAAITLRTSLSRFRTQCGYILFRVHFHAVEGARYLVESSRFRRLLTGSAT